MAGLIRNVILAPRSLSLRLIPCKTPSLSLPVGEDRLSCALLLALPLMSELVSSSLPEGGDSRSHWPGPDNGCCAG